MKNLDKDTVKSFSDQWVRYDQSGMENKEALKIFKNYFSIFPWSKLPKSAEGFDMGCGSGRWAQFIAPRVKHLNCVEPSEAIEVARRNLREFDNVSFIQKTTETCNLEHNSQDFGYSLGVLHHIPDTETAIKDCSALLKSGAPFLLYLYYNFENKPSWFRLAWKLSDALRRFISKLSSPHKKIICNTIAYCIYLPLSRGSYWIEKIGLNVNNIPLSDYRNKPFYICKNDALDRFGTRLEQRFSKKEITEMLERSGFAEINFSEATPFWCCLAVKK